ncbi:hypothetical protein GGS24DRAFT_161356 [Hypoxylon argillaceum]|nr:hypothetical protein GGS24DRAFT_161356 [Hypoxylon argillaceum]
MDSLPPELLAKIASFLPCTHDLISLRLVNKQYAAIASRPLFEVLRFSGLRQDQVPPWNFGPSPEPSLPAGHHKRTRTVEFGKLAEVVDEIVAKSIARSTKTFVFDPAYYREGFLRDYFLHRENEMNEPIDEVDYMPDSDSDGEGWNSALECALDYRQARPEREADTVEVVRALWAEKTAEQKQNEEAIVAALEKLFRLMTVLEEIEIKPWVFDGRLLFPGLESCISYAVDIQRRDSFPCTFFVQILARALRAVGRRIKHLRVSEFFADQLRDTPDTRHLFTGLQTIRLDMLHVEFLSDEAKGSQVLVELFKCAQPTLRHFSIVGGGKWPHHPARGGHSLLKMLSNEVGGADETPLAFPQLSFVCFGGLIMSTPPLLQFLRAQPSLKKLEFSNIYLSTRGAGWPSLVEALPMNVESWNVCGPLGHEPLEMDGPTAYNWMTSWEPDKLSPSLGWIAQSHKHGTNFVRVS